MDWGRLSDWACGKARQLGVSAGTGKPLPLTTTASRGLEGRGQSLLGSLLPLLSGFLVRFTELAKTEREAKRDLGTSGPSTRIFMANSSQPPNPGGTADPRTERGDLTLLCFSTSWVSFLSPNGHSPPILTNGNYILLVAQAPNFEVRPSLTFHATHQQNLSFQT